MVSVIFIELIELSVKLVTICIVDGTSLLLLAVINFEFFLFYIYGTESLDNVVITDVE